MILKYKINTQSDFTLKQISQTNNVVLLSDNDILKLLQNIYYLY